MKIKYDLGDMPEDLEAAVVAIDVLDNVMSQRLLEVIENAAELVSIKINFDTDIMTVKYRKPDNSLGQLARDLHMGDAERNFFMGAIP